MSPAQDDKVKQRSRLSVIYLNFWVVNGREVEYGTVRPDTSLVLEYDNVNDNMRWLSVFHVATVCHLMYSYARPLENPASGACWCSAALEVTFCSIHFHAFHPQ